MDKHLVYKTADNKIRLCIPSPNIQNTFNRYGKDVFINQHLIAAEHEVANGRSRAIHDRKLKWAAGVKNFNSLSEAELMGLVEADLPDDHKYKHWIHKDKINYADPLIGAWCDIDASGKVQYDEDKVTQIKGEK